MASVVAPTSVGGRTRRTTDHEDLAVGEVDQLDDAVDQRVAERHSADRAVRDAGDEVVEDPRQAVLGGEVLIA